MAYGKKRRTLTAAERAAEEARLDKLREENMTRGEEFRMEIWLQVKAEFDQFLESWEERRRCPTEDLGGPWDIIRRQIFEEHRRQDFW